MLFIFALTITLLFNIEEGGGDRDLLISIGVITSGADDVTFFKKYHDSLCYDERKGRKGGVM